MRLSSSIIIVPLLVILSGCSSSYSESEEPRHKISVAKELLNNGEYDKAYNILDDLGDSYPGSAEVQSQLGNFYSQAGASLKAKRSFERVMAAGQKVDAFLGFGKVALRSNNPDDAIKNFNKVLKLDSDNTEALNGLGVAYDIASDHVTAQSYYHQALSFDPNYEFALNNLAVSELLSGQSGQSQVVLEELFRSNLDNELYRLNLAMAMYVNSDRSNSIKLLNNEYSVEETIRFFDAVQKYRGQS